MTKPGNGRRVGAALLSLALLACSPGSSQQSPSGEPAPDAPEVATVAGLERLMFHDGFDSADTIDFSGHGEAGHLWYTDRPFGFGTLGRDEVRVSDSVLTIDQTKETFNYGIASVSATNGTGSAYRFGYFEARMAFDPTDSTNSVGWPSFWMLPRDRVTGYQEERWAELDVYEAWHEPRQPYDGNFVGTLHDWVRTSPDKVEDRSTVGNHLHPLEGVDFSQWHTYGVLWAPGHVTWYFDGRAILTQAYSSNVPDPNPQSLPKGTFTSLDDDRRGMSIILGSGVRYPMRIDWVRVWQ